MTAAEGVKLRKYERALQAVFDEHCPKGVPEDHRAMRFIGLVKVEDHNGWSDFEVVTDDTWAELAASLEEAMLVGNEPYAAWDADTGKSLPLAVKVIVSISADPGAAICEDL